MLKAKAQYSVESKTIRNTALGAKFVILVTSDQSSLEPAVENHCENQKYSFSHFITEGYVSLVGSKESNE